MSEPGRPADSTVLIVEDEEETADLYADMLAREFDVVTAYGGEDGLAKVDEDIDVVLLDRRMPELHGDAMLEELRQRNLNCRVVMVTAVDPDIDIIGLDFDDYLVKPVTEEELTETVRRMIDRQALDANLQEAFALATKMATLESRMDLDELEESQDYAELQARFADLRNRLDRMDLEDDLYGELSAVKLQALFDAA